MANYTQDNYTFRYDSTSDFSSTNAHRSVFTKLRTTPTKLLDMTVSVTTSGLTIDLDTFSTITSLIIENQDTASEVTAAFTDTATANVLTIPVSDYIKLASVGTIANDLLLDAVTSTAVCRVIVTGT
jgi:hypothetical protein